MTHTATPNEKSDAEHFGDLLRSEASRLRALADRLGPVTPAQGSFNSLIELPEYLDRLEAQLLKQELDRMVGEETPPSVWADRVRSALAAQPPAARVETKPFYGAKCPSYPNCNGGCGLGCTQEIEQHRCPRSLADTEARIALADELMLPGGTHPYLGRRKRDMIVAALRAASNEPQGKHQ
ncbi:hypothetical protein ACRQ5Q_24450 [Bradyrhizobium sp. PMVTL-01]|uniref:hypothetical protein n=1 Tax=Bradyrhizobium sp. PMVTL-01 TaxID=3434999 RepID=UPI003F7027FF